MPLTQASFSIQAWSLQLRRLGVDAAEEMIVGAIEEDDHVFQMLALVGDAQGMDHRLLLLVALAQPQPVIETASCEASPLNVLRFQAANCAEHARGDRRERR